MSRLVQIFREIAVFPIRLYQRILSPHLRASCRFYPSCSEYTAQAFLKHGILPGLMLGVWRIMRCNPFATGGVDLVPEKPWWRGLKSMRHQHDANCHHPETPTATQAGEEHHG